MSEIVLTQAQIIAALVGLLPAGTVVTLPTTEAPALCEHGLPEVEICAEVAERRAAERAYQAKLAAKKAPAKAPAKKAYLTRGRLEAFQAANAWAAGMSCLDIAIAIERFGVPVKGGFVLGEGYQGMAQAATVKAVRAVDAMLDAAGL